MKNILALLLTACLLAAPMTFASAEATVDLSCMEDEQLVALLAQVQREIVARHIGKTASLTAGTYIGGRDIPAGAYILSAAGTGEDRGILSLRSADDPADRYPSKLYEYRKGDESYSVFVTIGEGDTLAVPFPCTLTISCGIMFQ
ncbi:MAG: hypothetical protein ACI4O7_13890 [Aristaeellaceae bacterium]